MSDTYAIPTPPRFRKSPAAHIVSRVFTLNFLSHVDGSIRSVGCDWFELMRKNNLNYKLRQALVDLANDAGHIKACRQLNAQDRQRSRQRARQATGPREHVTHGSCCPTCGRASVERDGYCAGGLVRRHPPARRRAALVSYYR